MFGLMSFPDRAAGFHELRRVLRPGGRVVVSSWRPFDQVPAMAALFAAVGEHVPQARSAVASALSDADTFRHELEGAGFHDVVIHEADHSRTFPDVDAFWSSHVRATAPIVLLRGALGEAAFAALGDRIRSALRGKLGTGEVDLAFPAWIGVGLA
jgi:SAM-dependent methyltransferase